MTENNISALFLRETAAKHFLCMSYTAIIPLGATEFDYASCFVVEIEGQWILITAGHVITRLKEVASNGVHLSEFMLHDQLAGNRYPFGVPYPFAFEDWVVIDNADADIAVAPLSAMLAANLEAGGIRPIKEDAWGTPPLDQYQYWILAGIPAESHARANNFHTLKLTIVPLQPATAPSSSTDSTSTEKVFGKIVTQPDLDNAVVNDVKGMSGAPIYGVKEVDGALRYWLIGVQSSWLPSSRIVAFFPPLPLLHAIKEAIRQLKAREAQRTT